MGEGLHILLATFTNIYTFLPSYSTHKPKLINRNCIERGRRNSRPTARVSPNPSLLWKNKSTDFFYMRSTIKAVRFISDDQAFFVSMLGLVVDASPALGAPRAKVCISALLHALLSL